MRERYVVCSMGRAEICFVPKLCGETSHAALGEVLGRDTSKPLFVLHRWLRVK